jgi:hypothetical protein
MRQHDLLQIPRRTAETTDGRKDAATIGVEERVDDGEIMSVIKEEGVDAPPTPLPEAVDSWGDLHRTPPCHNAAYPASSLVPLQASSKRIVTCTDCLKTLPRHSTG